jgi:Fe-S-cluster containining protein
VSRCGVRVALRMIPSATSSAASRLCTACGLCCNGVMFHTVRMQPGDSAKALAALGLKLKRKKGQNYILQPCPAFRGAQCAIYAARPERCRLFECRQLQRVASGESTEDRALESIRDVQRRVGEVDALLLRAGGTDGKKPLAKRCEKVMAEPLDTSSDGEVVALRTGLMQAMRELETILDEDFRLPRAGTAPAEAAIVALGVTAAR